jgi:hypothetical protein
VALAAIVEIYLLVCLTLRGWRHIQNLCGFSTLTVMGQSFITTLYIKEISAAFCKRNNSHHCWFAEKMTFAIHNLTADEATPYVKTKTKARTYPLDHNFLNALYFPLSN